MFSKPANAYKVSPILRSGYTLAAMLCSLAIAAVVGFIPTSRGANPASGSVSESTPKVNWTGQIKAPSGSSDCGSGNNAGCDNYSFNFQPPSSSYGSYLLEVKLMPQGDWDMQVYGPNGNLLDGSGNSPGQLEIVTLINPPAGNYLCESALTMPLFRPARPGKIKALL